MKIITCFKLVPEEQDIVVTPEYTLNFDNADAKISQFDLNASKTPRLSRFAFSDDPKWESGHHVHDNETELIYVKKGVARFTIDSSLYVAHADDIVVIERGRLKNG